MRQLEAARGPPLGSQWPTATDRGSAVETPAPPALLTSEACAAPGRPAWAIAPFRSVSAPDGSCTAPSTLALRPSAVLVGFRRRAADLLVPGLHWTARSARDSGGPCLPASRCFPGPTLHLQPPVAGGPSYSPAAAGEGVVRELVGSTAAWRAPRKRRVSGLEPGGPAWPRCVLASSWGCKGAPPAPQTMGTGLLVSGDSKVDPLGDSNFDPPHPR